MENIPYIPELPNSTWATQEQCVAELELLRAENAKLSSANFRALRIASELAELRAENELLSQGILDLQPEKVIAEMTEVMNERDELSARLAELEKQEPVGEIVRTETSHGCDRTAISWLKYPYAKYGAKLYLSPVVSPDVEKLKAENERLKQIKSRNKSIDLLAENQSLKTELEAARKNSERLDWLLAHSDATVCSDGVYGPFHIWFRYSNRTTDEALTARAAIDAAIEQAKSCNELHEKGGTA